MAELKETVRATVKPEVIYNFLKISKVTFFDWVKKGIIPRGEKGQYHFLDSVQSAWLHLRKIQAEGADPTLTEERTKLVKIQREQAELDYLKDAKKVIPISLIIAQVNLVFTKLRMKLIGRSRKMAPLLFNCKTIAEVQVELEKSDYECLESMANLDQNEVEKDFLKMPESKPPANFL